MSPTRPLTVALAVMLAAGSAAAQEAPPADLGGGASGEEPIAGASLIIDQQRADRLPVAPATPGPQIAPPAAATAPAPPSTAMVIGQVQIEGSSLPAESLSPAWSDYVGRPLTQANLQALANALTHAYAQSGLALYSVKIPAQTFEGGVVRVTVTEGLIGQVAITGEVKTKHLRLLKRYSAKLADERPLTRRTLERYLSLIRDIPGLEVAPSLQPTKLPGVSVLTLDIKRRRVKPELAVHDRGTPRLGRVQLQGTVIINSLFQQGDTSRLTVAAPTEWDPFQYVAVSHSQPIGSEGLRLTASAGLMRTRPKDSPIEGDAVTVGLSLTYPIVRGFRDNLYVTAALDGQDSDNAVLGRTLSSDHTRAARLGFSWSRARTRHATQAAATVSQGLDILGAETNEHLTDPDFRKINLHLAHSRRIGEQLSARLRGTAQLSEGRLPSAEQFVLGGEPFGRAFSNAYLVGDMGVAASTELAWTSQTLWPAPLKGSELYTFADWGMAHQRERLGGLAPEATRDLSSAGLGVRLNWRRKTVFNIEGATALENPYPEAEAWRLLFGWRSTF